MTVQEQIRKKLGFLVNMSASGSGNLNNRYISQQFFDPKSRDTICEMIHNDANRENFKVLLRSINVMLTVCLSERAGVNTDSLKQLGIDIMYHIRTAFLDEKGKPWIPINPSLNSLCVHSRELFKMPSGPIVIFSKQAQEHWNKHVASFKSGCGTHARQRSIKENLHDILTRMLCIF